MGTSPWAQAPATDSPEVPRNGFPRIALPAQRDCGRTIRNTLAAPGMAEAAGTTAGENHCGRGSLMGTAALRRPSAETTTRRYGTSDRSCCGSRTTTPSGVMDTISTLPGSWCGPVTSTWSPSCIPAPGSHSRSPEPPCTGDWKPAVRNSSAGSAWAPAAASRMVQHPIRTCRQMDRLRADGKASLQVRCRRHLSDRMMGQG